MRVEMNTTWVVWALVLPFGAALCVAAPFWIRRVSDEMGSVAGTGLVLAFVVAFIAREFGEVEVVTRRCVDASIGCHFHPTPFVRYAIFAGIGMLQMVVLFLVGLFVEERLRERERMRDASV